MVRLRKFDHTKNVLEAARERMAHIYTVFDSVVISCSGGKDSLAVLALALEVQDGPVNVVFRDIEFLPQSLLDVIERVRLHPRVNLRYIALSSAGNVNILGRKFDFVHWDPNRDWPRKPPPHAEIHNERVLTAQERDDLVTNHLPGRVALTTGVRAAESLLRYRASVNKINEPYINASPAGPRVSLCKPLYDWEERDVFKYLAEQGWEWAHEYEARVYAGAGELRTGSAIAPEELRNVRSLREGNPELYAQLLEAIPEVAVADRYYADYDRYSEESDMLTIDDVEAWVTEFYAAEPHALAAALARVDFARRLAVANPDGFPAWWVYREVKRDGHGKGMMAIPTTHPRHPANQKAKP